MTSWLHALSGICKPASTSRGPEAFVMMSDRHTNQKLSYPPRQHCWPADSHFQYIFCCFCSWPATSVAMSRAESSFFLGGRVASGLWIKLVDAFGDPLALRLVVPTVCHLYVSPAVSDCIGPISQTGFSASVCTPCGRWTQWDLG
jgi:hypothetical protein